MWGIVASWRFRIVKIVPFQYPRWPPSWNNIYQTISWIESKLDGRHQSDIQFQNCKNLWFQYPRWPPLGTSKNSLNLDISFQTVSKIELKLDGRHWSNTEIQNWKKLFHSNIQEGGYLEILQMTFPPKGQDRLRWNMMGGIQVTERFRIAKLFRFPYPAAILDIGTEWVILDIGMERICYFSNNISQTLRQIKPKLDRKNWSDI